MSYHGGISYRVDVLSYVFHMSYILWLFYHTYNRGYMIDNLGVMTVTVDVLSDIIDVR